MAINKHGLKMNGLRAASNATRGLSGDRNGECVEVFYNMRTGYVWEIRQPSPDASALGNYANDPDVIKINNIFKYKDMQKIADAIYVRSKWEKMKRERGE